MPAKIEKTTCVPYHEITEQLENTRKDKIMKSKGKNYDFAVAVILVAAVFFSSPFCSFVVLVCLRFCASYFVSCSDYLRCTTNRPLSLERLRRCVPGTLHVRR